MTVFTACCLVFLLLLLGLFVRKVFNSHSKPAVGQVKSFVVNEDLSRSTPPFEFHASSTLVVGLPEIPETTSEQEPKRSNNDFELTNVDWKAQTNLAIEATAAFSQVDIDKEDCNSGENESYATISQAGIETKTYEKHTLEDSVEILKQCAANDVSEAEKIQIEFLSNKNNSSLRAYSNDNISNQAFRDKKMALLRSVLGNDNDEIDDSIIDVTDQSHNLDHSNSLEVEDVDVPEWPHQYVYSYKAIRAANEDQLRFYMLFRNLFLENRYLNTKGNSNYPFILLFDLIDQYNIHKNLNLLSNQLTALGLHYPKTDSYAKNFFQRIKTRGIENTASAIPKPVEDFYRYPTGEAQEYWKLGSKYRNRLGLNKEQEILLNQLWTNSNSFCNIEFCYLEVIKLYLLAYSLLNQQLAAETTSLSEQMKLIADLVARKQFRYRKGSLNYNNTIQNILPQLHSYLFKLCENLVRETFGHKRKLSTDFTFTTSEVVAKEFQMVILRKFEALSQELKNSIQMPDEKTDVELNGLNPGRWKIEFERYKVSLAENPEKFVEAILVLGHKNRKNPTLEGIFYEGFKFLSSYKRQPALQLYVYYVSHGLKLASFENKKISKNIQKLLFDNELQFEQFKNIITSLKVNRDVIKASKAIFEIFTIKRKTVQLDRDLIKDVMQLHSGTVELLNKVLNEDMDDISSLSYISEIPMGLQTPTVIDKNILTESIFVATLAFDKIQLEALNLFYEYNLSLPLRDLETYCLSRGLFKNQLVDSINEICFDLLDDVLIEAEEDYYTIDPSYYQRLLKL